MARRRVRLTLAAAASLVFSLVPGRANAVAGANFALNCNSDTQCVQAECVAHIALFETDGQLTVVVSGSAQAEGPLAPAATRVACTLRQVDILTGEVNDVGGCSLRLPGAASACAEPVENVNIGTFEVCAAGDAAFIPDGFVTASKCTLIGPID